MKTGGNLRFSLLSRSCELRRGGTARPTRTLKPARRPPPGCSGISTATGQRKRYLHRAPDPDGQWAEPCSWSRTRRPMTCMPGRPISGWTLLPLRGLEVVDATEPDVRPRRPGFRLRSSRRDLPGLRGHGRSPRRLGQRHDPQGERSRQPPGRAASTLTRSPCSVGSRNHARDTQRHPLDPGTRLARTS